LAVNSGTISTTLASTSDFGVVKIDTSSGLAVNSGVLSVSPADGASPGYIVSSPDVTVAAGQATLSTDYFKKSQVNYFGLKFASFDQPFSSSITIDGTTGNFFYFTATSNFTLNQPTNFGEGGWMFVLITQDGTGSRTITLPSYFKSVNGVSITLTTTPGAMDLLEIVAYTDTFAMVRIHRNFA
jgi:hypothetical protein